MHLAFPANVLLQVLEETLKSPVVDTTTLWVVVLRTLAKVNVLAAVLVPTCWLANFALAGVNVTGITPTPVSATDWGPFPELSKISRSAFRDFSPPNSS